MRTRRDNLTQILLNVKRCHFRNTTHTPCEFVISVLKTLKIIHIFILSQISPLVFIVIPETVCVNPVTKISSKVCFDGLRGGAHWDCVWAVSTLCEWWKHLGCTLECLSACLTVHVLEFVEVVDHLGVNHLRCAPLAVQSQSLHQPPSTRVLGRDREVEMCDECDGKRQKLHC